MALFASVVGSRSMTSTMGSSFALAFIAAAAVGPRRQIRPT
jgi:hypothetical protein